MDAQFPGTQLAARLADNANAGDFVEELGFAAGVSKEAFRAVLALLPRFDETGLAQLVGALTRTQSRPDDGSPGYLALQAATGGALPSPPADGSTLLPGWHAETIADALTEARPELSWPTAMTLLDQPGFVVPDARCFAFLCHLYARASREPFPLNALVGGVWQNTAGQLSLLRHAVAAQPELFSWAHCPRRLGLPEGTPNSKASAAVLANGAWLCADLHGTLARLAEVDGLAAVRTLLEAPAAVCPEVLLLGAATMRTQWGLLQGELFAALLPGAVGLPGGVSGPAATPTSPPGLLQRLWAVPAGRDALLRVMVDAHAVQPACLGRVLDLVQELKALTAVLDATPPSFSIDLAALAARREYLNLEKWAGEAIMARGRPWVVECLRFLRAKAAGQTDGASQGINLSTETAALFFRALSAASPSFPPDLGEELRAVFSAASALNPRLASLGGADAGSYASGTPPPAPPGESFSPDVEEEANAVFQKIYTGSQSIDTVIGMLSAFSSRGGRRERDVFACMVHNLFDEYRFFPKYPDKELRITALLFGALVARRLVTGAHLGVALRYVLEALRKPPGTKMFAFGADAAEQFRSRVHEWPPFCAAALQIPHLQLGAPELAALLERAALGGPAPYQSGAMTAEMMGSAAEMAAAAVLGGASGEAAEPAGRAGGTYSVPLSGPATDSVVDRPPSVPPVGSSSSAAAPPGLARTSSLSGSAARLEPSAAPFLPAPSFATSLNIDTLLGAQENSAVVLPDDATVDRVHFAFNNLSTANVAAKAADIASRLDASHWPWLATYLVVKRASLEPNFHPLYAGLLEALAQPALTAIVVGSSVFNIRVLLRGDKIKTASGERSLLKNLGSWLGVLTLGRGRPLLARQLDLKALLLDAYTQGAMIAVIPFVGKVLEPARGSRIFAPPNPWTVAILGLLAEIYGHPELKLNLKFEVERLFKHLGISVSDVPQPAILASRARPPLSSADFVGGKVPIAVPASQPQAPPASAAVQDSGAPVEPPKAVPADGELPALATPSVPAPGGWPLAGDASLLSHLSSSCVFSSGVTVFVERLALRRLLPLALERAIREVVTPVVERSVTIACMTTRELVLKDFAVEADEAALRRGAHLMAASLAGSLALVTCKEPLRVSAANALRGLLASQRGAAELEPALLEQAVAMACGDNLELGCTLIEASAQEKARRDVDDALSAAYSLRRQHRDVQPSAPFHDIAHAAGRYPAVLPDALRPHAFREKPAQMRVYEDFSQSFRNSGVAALERAASARASGAPFSGSAEHLAAEPRLVGAMGSGEGLPFVHVHDFEHGGSDGVGERLHAALSRLDAAMAQSAPGLPAGVQEEVLAALTGVADALAASSSRDDAACTVAATALTRVFERRAPPVVTSSSLALLELAARVSRRAGTEASAATLYGDAEPRVCGMALDRLLRCGALEAGDLDRALAALLVGPRAAAATEMATSLVQLSLLAPDACILPAQLGGTLDKLAVLAETRQGPSAEPLTALLDAVRELLARQPAAGRGEAGRRSGAPDSGAADLPPAGDLALRDLAAAQFDEWARVCDAPAGDALYTSFFSGFMTSGLMGSEEAQSRTFRILTELVVAHCLGSEPATPTMPPVLNFAAVDAYARLVLMLARFYGRVPGARGALTSRVALLSRGLTAAVSVLLRDQDERGAAFNPRPYFRVLSTWLAALASPDPALDLASPAVGGVFAHALLAVQPLRAPGFAFAWLELVSHRALLPRLAAASAGELQPGASPAGWPLLGRLLTGCLRFLEPRLRAAELSDPARALYRGLLRVLLLLLHDVPEFLCDYAPTLCDAIPPSCIQMRNLVLSAFPRAMRLPDPFTPNLKVDLLPDIAVSPRVALDTNAVLHEVGGGLLVAELEGYLETRQPFSLPSELRGALLLPPAAAATVGTRYNVPLLNALVLHCGTAAIVTVRREGDTGAPGAAGSSSASMDIFSRLASELDLEGRYLFLNAIANHLRYPNAHTHYFSCVLLHLFAEAGAEAVREQVTRVLLERLIVNRPHPWGLLITFIELIKNPRYSFWSHSFTRATPEIERLFQSVARSALPGGERAASGLLKA